MNDRPDATELLEAVRRFIETEHGDGSDDGGCAVPARSRPAIESISRTVVYIHVTPRVF